MTTVLELFNAEQDKNLSKSKLIKEIHNFVNDKSGKPSVNELLNFYLKTQKGEQPLARISGSATITLSIILHEPLSYHSKDKIEIVYYRHVEDEKPSQSFSLKLESDNAGDFLITDFSYENVTATEVKELINLVLYGKRNINESKG